MPAQPRISLVVTALEKGLPGLAEALAPGLLADWVILQVPPSLLVFFDPISGRPMPFPPGALNLFIERQLPGELMAFGLRQAGGTPCGTQSAIVNVLNDSSAAPWFTSGLRGYGGTDALGSKVDGTDGIAYGYPASLGVTVTEHNPSSAQFKVSEEDHGITEETIAMVCDNTQATIFQVTNANDANKTIVHNTGGSVSPGNRDKKFGILPAANGCGGSKGDDYQYCKNSVLVSYTSTAWYVGCNGRGDCDAPGGRSLYQAIFPNAAQEVVPDVQSMQLAYKVGDAYVAAGSVSDWTQVTAVRITLVLVGPESGATTGANDNRLTRTLTHVVALRNQIS
jgi:type IV pilus assembly protein PilW